MKKETIDRIVSEYLAVHKNPVNGTQEFDGLGTHLSEVFEQEKRLRQQIFKLRELRLKEEKSRAEFDKEMKSQLKDIQNECPHYEFSFYGDPSGNNDSYFVCDLCGKEW